MTEITWPLNHKLSRPIEASDGSVSIEVLTLREPTVADFLKHGVLDGGLTGDTMIGLVSDLSGHLPPMIKLIPGLDFLRLTKKLSGFFNEAAS